MRVMRRIDDHSLVAAWDDDAQAPVVEAGMEVLDWPGEDRETFMEELSAAVPGEGLGEVFILDSPAGPPAGDFDAEKGGKVVRAVVPVPEQTLQQAMTDLWTEQGYASDRAPTYDDWQEIFSRLRN